MRTLNQSIQRLFCSVLLVSSLQTLPVAAAEDLQKEVTALVNDMAQSRYQTEAQWHWLGLPFLESGKVYLSDHFIREKYDEPVSLNEFLEFKPQLTVVNISPINKSPDKDDDFLKFTKGLGWTADTYIITVKVKYQMDKRDYEDTQALLIHRSNKGWKIHGVKMISGMHEEGG